MIGKFGLSINNVWDFPKSKNIYFVFTGGDLGGLNVQGNNAERLFWGFNL